MALESSAPHILLVDESSELRAIFSRALQGAGFCVTTSAVVPDLASVRRLKPDGIVHELMFDRDLAPALAFLRALRQDAILAGVPAILCTAAHEAVTDAALASDLRALDLSVLLKPVPLQDLMDCITQACSVPRQLQLQHRVMDLEPAWSRETVLHTADRLIQAAYPHHAPEVPLEEGDAVPRLFATAMRLQAMGDLAMSRVMRSWLWDGIVAMLEDAGYELAIGGAVHYQGYAAFLRGEGAASIQTLRPPTNIVPFPGERPR